MCRLHTRLGGTRLAKDPDPVKGRQRSLCNDASDLCEVNACATRRSDRLKDKLVGMRDGQQSEGRQ